jgi:putative membrane protein
MWGAHEGMGWWMLLGMIWFVVFWGLVIYLIFWAGGRVFRERTSEDTPIEILKRRYARGDLSHEEFERMKRELGLE